VELTTNSKPSVAMMRFVTHTSQRMALFGTRGFRGTPMVRNGLKERRKLARSSTFSNVTRGAQEEAISSPFSLGWASAEVPHPDGLTRWPGISSPQAWLRTCDLIGTASFAASGCMTAGFAGMDILGCTLVGTITAVGGPSTISTRI